MLDKVERVSSEGAFDFRVFTEERFCRVLTLDYKSTGIDREKPRHGCRPIALHMDMNLRHEVKLHSHIHRTTTPVFAGSPFGQWLRKLRAWNPGSKPYVKRCPFTFMCTTVPRLLSGDDKITII